MSDPVKFVFEGKCDPRWEDSGCAMISDGYHQVPPVENEERGLFVRVQSWDEKRTGSKVKSEAFEHESARKLIGKKLRITVEVIDE